MAELPAPIAELLETLGATTDWEGQAIYGAGYQWRADGILATVVVDETGALWTFDIEHAAPAVEPGDDDPYDGAPRDW